MIQYISLRDKFAKLGIANNYSNGGPYVRCESKPSLDGKGIEFTLSIPNLLITPERGIEQRIHIKDIKNSE